MWQDYIITVVQVVFLVALLPTLFDTQKPATLTSLMNGGGMVIIAAAYFSLGLWWSGTVAALVAAQWLILAKQRSYLEDRKA